MLLWFGLFDFIRRQHGGKSVSATERFLFVMRHTGQYGSATVFEPGGNPCTVQG